MDNKPTLPDWINNPESLLKSALIARKLFGYFWTSKNDGRKEARLISPDIARQREMQDKNYLLYHTVDSLNGYTIPADGFLYLPYYHTSDALIREAEMRLPHNWRAGYYMRLKASFEDCDTWTNFDLVTATPLRRRDALYKTLVELTSHA